MDKTTTTRLVYDYSSCPACTGKNTSAMTNDGGRVAWCQDCKQPFQAIPVLRRNQQLL